MRNTVSGVTDAEIMDEARETMAQAAFDAADEAAAADAVEAATEELSAFNELGLSELMLKAVDALGYTAPTPVQAKSIPEVLAGHDLLAAAQTGTGKTAAFLLPTMNGLAHVAPPKPVKSRGRGRGRGGRGGRPGNGNGAGPLMLIITPTRELAQQIDEVASKIADVTGHVAVTVVGGVSYNPQKAALRHGCDILVATPGRLVDLIEQGACHLDDVRVLVLDEADRMLDMGFLPAVRKIVSHTPAERQTLLFSATLDDAAVGEIADLVHDPARVEIAPATSTADTVDQYVLPVSMEAKNTLLPAFLKKEGSERTIVFMRTKHRADACVRRLEKAGIRAATIHGNRSQAQREHALSDFRNGKVDCLVATDVLARGIDISDVRYVVNFDVPDEPTDYIHRIGRTGRAGELGWAITFVTDQDIDEFYDIEKLMDKTADIYDAGDLKVGSKVPAIDPDRDPAAYKPRKKTKRGKSKSKKKLERARQEGKRKGDEYGDVAGRSNRGRDDRPARPKRGGKTRVREGVQKHVDDAVESVARDMAGENGDAAPKAERKPAGNRAERRAAKFAGETRKYREEDEYRGGRRRVERDDRGGHAGHGSRGKDGHGASDSRKRRGYDGNGADEDRNRRRNAEDGNQHGKRRRYDEGEGARGNRRRNGAGENAHDNSRNGSRSRAQDRYAKRSDRDRRDPRATRERSDDWRNYDDTREERRRNYRGNTGSRGGRAGGRDNRGSYGSRSGRPNASRPGRNQRTRRPGDGGGRR